MLRRLISTLSFNFRLVSLVAINFLVMAVPLSYFCINRDDQSILFIILPLSLLCSLAILLLVQHYTKNQAKRLEQILENFNAEPSDKPSNSHELESVIDMTQQFIHKVYSIAPHVNASQ